VAHPELVRNRCLPCLVAWLLTLLVIELLAVFLTVLYLQFTPGGAAFGSGVFWYQYHVGLLPGIPLWLFLANYHVGHAPRFLELGADEFTYQRLRWVSRRPRRVRITVRTASFEFVRRFGFGMYFVRTNGRMLLPNGGAEVVTKEMIFLSRGAYLRLGLQAEPFRWVYT
jgi:hypothetical protein